MEALAAVEELERQVRRRIVDATFTVDAPSSPEGTWWVDVQRFGRVASIEWRPGVGYGVAEPGGGYGEGVDFVVDDASAAAAHVARVLHPDGSTKQISAVVDASQMQRQLIEELSAHIDRAVGEILRTTVETLLFDLRARIGDMSADVHRIEQELLRISDKVLGGRNASSDEAENASR
ncbi:MAG: hypothetical protein JOZ54_05680 [Acidobacteria bacterium]|nr:hypothetical protein [Acidobacteriota bacterium]